MKKSKITKIIKNDGGVAFCKVAHDKKKPNKKLHLIGYVHQNGKCWGKVEPKAHTIKEQILDKHFSTLFGG